MASILLEASSQVQNFENVPEKLNQEPILNKTASELIKEQADSIKKVVSSQKPTQVDYPTVTMHEPAPNIDFKAKEEKERQSIEELRLKCQNLFKISTESQPETTTPLATAIPFGPVQKPQFLQGIKPIPLATTHNKQNIYIIESNPSWFQTYPKNKPQQMTLQYPPVQTTFETNENQNKQPQSSFTYVTSDKNTQTNLQTTEVLVPVANEEAVKYVKLEPVFLHRGIVTNGRNLYYLYMKNSQQVPPGYTAQNFQYVTNINQEQTTIAPATTEIPSQASAAAAYTHQLKFVVPYTYQNPNKIQNSAWQADPYNYYPKNPQTYQIPYVPTYPMIRTLNVPHNPEQAATRNLDDIETELPN